MGNVLSEEEATKRIESIEKLNRTVKTELNLDNFRGIGSTGYLDLINPDWIDPNTNIVKGYDSERRPFFAFFAVVVFSDDTKLQTFTTFFQRYSDNQVCWMFCGHLGQPLFCSSGTGGSGTEQFELMTKFIETGQIILTDENAINDIYIDSKIYYPSYDQTEKSPYPTKIYLGRI
jgi:hypothetical protein